MESLNTDNRSDNEVMQTVVSGEIQQLQVLFRRYHRILNAFFSNHGCDPTISQDLTQETFLRILKARTSFKTRYSFKSWMFRIARNVHIDHYRRVIRRGEVQPSDEMPSFVDASIQESNQSKWENHDQLKQALGKLDPEHREILFLARFEQLNYREISHVTGYSENNVKIRVFRALQQLKEHFFQLSERTPV